MWRKPVGPNAFDRWIRTIAMSKLADALRRDPVGEHRVQVTASMGVSAFPPHGKSTAELIERADEALYQAKAAGRDRIRIYGSKHYQSSA